MPSLSGRYTIRPHEMKNSCNVYSLVFYRPDSIKSRLLRALGVILPVLVAWLNTQSSKPRSLLFYIFIYTLKIYLFDSNSSNNQALGPVFILNLYH